MSWRNMVDVKQGGDFLLEMTRFEDDGVTAIDVSATVITASVEDGQGGFVSLDVTKTDAPNGAFEVSKPGADTASWPLQKLLADVRFVDGGAVSYSQTFVIRVQDAITDA